MKKWLLGIGVALILSVIAIYVLIPAEIKISSNILTGCSAKNVSAFLHDQQKWVRWWPHQAVLVTPDSFFNYNDGRYKLTKPLAEGGEIQLMKENKKIETSIFLFPVNRDSTALMWQTSFTASTNPIKRIAQYLEAVRIKKDMKAILESFRLFIDKPENIYGITVKRDTVKIDFMVSTKKSFSHYPTTQEVYEMIADIKKYVAQQAATLIDHPMLSIMELDSLHYQTQVAIPVDKKLPETDIFSFKWMPKGGNMLISPVQGDIKTIEEAQRQFKAYVTDHQLTVMAIPFQSLVTDRMKEPDSSKWVTWLYYPVM
jgi:hypothetical protein